MASVLASGSNQLVVAMFGQRIAFASGPGGVTCTSGALSEQPSNMKSVFTMALGWMELPAPRPLQLLGPVFEQEFKFFDTYNQPTCYAVHGDSLGVRENPAMLQHVMELTNDWLTAHGV